MFFIPYWHFVYWHCFYLFYYFFYYFLFIRYFFLIFCLFNFFWSDFFANYPITNWFIGIIFFKINYLFFLLHTNTMKIGHDNIYLFFWYYLCKNFLEKIIINMANKYPFFSVNLSSLWKVHGTLNDMVFKFISWKEPCIIFVQRIILFSLECWDSV